MSSSLSCVVSFLLPTSRSTNVMAWRPTSTSASLGIAIHNFSARKDCELALDIGDEVRIVEESSCGNWYRGYLHGVKPQQLGIFPSCYIQLRSCILIDRGKESCIVGNEEPIALEVVTVLREWVTEWKRLYAEAGGPVVPALRATMEQLIKWRRDIVFGSLRSDQILPIKSKIASKIDWGNRKLDLNTVIRNDQHEEVDVKTTSVVDLYQLCVKSLSQSQGGKAGDTAGQLFHIYCDVEEVSCFVPGEDTDLYLSLYDSKRQKYISERFVINSSRTAAADRQCLFTDLDKEDMGRLQDWYLVCHVIRNGRMDLSSKKSGGMFRRPISCAALPLLNLKAVNAADSSLRHISGQCFPITEEKDFASLHEHVIKKTIKSTDRSGSLSVGMRTMQGDHPTIREQHSGLIDKCTPQVRKLGIGEAVKPGEFRNDFFVTIEKGDFEKSSKSPPNIEILMQVVNAEGQAIPVICPAANQEPVDEYRCYIIYHCSSPRWHETVRLAIPVLDMNYVQIKFTVYHCSSSGGNAEPRSVHLKPILQNGTTIQDGVYSLTIDSTRETLVCSTQICSTKLTQDINLLGLLRWRMLKKSELMYALKNVLLVSGKDVCLFMQDIFDALFSIVDQEDEVCGQLAFNAIVKIINILLEQHNAHFRESLDVYISRHFSAALVYKKLINNIRGYLDHGTDPDVSNALLATLCSLEYLMKFVLQSRNLFARTFHTINLVSFKENIKLTILSIAGFLKQTNPALLSNQRVALNQLGVCQELLLSICETNDLAHDIIHVVRIFLRRREATDAALDLIASLASKLETADAASDSPALNTVFKKLLPDLVSFIATESNSQGSEGHLALACCSLLGFLRMATVDHFSLIITKSPESLQFLEDLCNTFSSLLAGSLGWESWHALSFLQAEVIASTLADITEIVFDVFKLGANSSQNNDLLLMLFELCSMLITQNYLQLESLPTSRQLMTKQTYGDIRVSLAETMAKMWKALGQHQVSYVLPLSPFFVKASLVQEQTVRKLLLPMFVDILVLTIEDTDSVQEVYDDLQASFDALIASGMGDCSFIEALTTVWEEGIPAASLPEVKKDQCLVLARRILKLASLLIDYRLIRTGSIFSASHNMAIVNYLMEFYRESGQPETCTNCLLILIDLHLAANNWSEAAFALLTCANTLEFEDKQILPAELSYPYQTAGERKAALLMDSIQNFGKGKLWEDGIQVCEQYVKHLKESFDFQRVAEVLHLEATYFESIVNIHRPSREYFRVGHYGKGFLPSLRNKVFVYRGQEYEKLGAFSERILQSHFGAELMKTNQPPGDDILQSDKCHLQICTVKPIPEASPVSDHDVNPYISEFYETHRVSQFVYSRPFHKGPKDKENEFKSLWLERTTVETVNPLPNILPWAEVIKTTVSIVKMFLANECMQFESSSKTEALLSTCSAFTFSQVTVL